MCKKRGSMSISRSSTIVLAMLVAFGTTSFAAKTSSGKVRSVIGDVTRQKSNDDSWTPLRVGAKVQGKDKIKTLVESLATIALPDGSTISVEENSEVEFSTLVSENGVQASLTEIKSGKIRFDVQKQQSAQSKFMFKTGTATAAIRGTDGTIGVTKGGGTIGALNNGAMDMEENGQKVQVQAKQFVAFRKGKAPVVGEAQNAGDPSFVEQLSAAVDDTTKSDADIVAAAKTLDAQIQKEKEDLKSKYKCEFKAVPEVVDTNTISIEGKCSAGMKVSLGAETIESDGNAITFTPTWAAGALGDKKFIINCTVGKQSFECGKITTKYQKVQSAAFGAVNQQECSVAYTTHGFEDNKGAVKFLVDGKLAQEIVLDKDSSGTIKFDTGTHSYTLSVDGSAPVTKEFKCFPVTEVAIDILNGSSEKIVKKVSQGAFTYPELKFVIKNVLNNDPAQIKSVIVKIGDQKFDTKFIPAKDGIGYSSKVKIGRGKSVAEVLVTMQSGKIIRATKSYEFR